MIMLWICCANTFAMGNIFKLWVGQNLRYFSSKYTFIWKPVLLAVSALNIAFSWFQIIYIFQPKKKKSLPPPAFPN